MNYRKFYQDELGVTIPKGFDIHHIDEDNQNNIIENLVALPRKLHQKYHELSIIRSISIDTEISFQNCNRGLCFELPILENFHNVLQECFPYIVYRDILLDRLPACILNYEKLY